VAFCAPEIARPLLGGNCSSRWLAHADEGPKGSEVTGNVSNSHMELLEEMDLFAALAAADAWSVGAIAFLLLCGYPPFFAPCRHHILSRIDKIDFSFDPPFWSKISEDAKDFVQQCLRDAAGRRLPVCEAQRHPWVRDLADSSPQGSMLPAFINNLRRFYRTSLIEAYAANCLSEKMRHGEVEKLYSQCLEADVAKCGYLTSADLRHILEIQGHTEVAEAIAVCFTRTLRYPGESYIDYGALTASIAVRRERLLEEELWRHFQDFACAACGGGGYAREAEIAGLLPLDRLNTFLQNAEVQRLLQDSGAPDTATLSTGLHGCRAASEAQAVDFNDLAAEILWQQPRQAAVTGIVR